MKGDWTTRGFQTRAIHAGQQPDPATGSVTVPIYATSTYVHDELGVHKGFEYARVQNPTRFALEANLAALEGGATGHAFASGMSAIAALMTLVRTRRARRLLAQRLRRHLPLHDPGARPLRARVLLGRLDRSRQRARRDEADHAHRLRRDADQPDDGGDRHRRRGRARPRPRRAPRGRQHLHVALLPAAARARRRRRRALDDQVLERPLRLDRRRAHREVGRAGGVVLLRAEVGGGDPLALRQLPRAARREDARRPHGAPRGERPRARRAPRAPSEGASGSSTRGSPTTPATPPSSASRPASAPSSPSTSAATRRRAPSSTGSR